MDAKNIELAKQKYKEETGVKRVSIKPVVIRGTTLTSDVFVEVNGQRKLLVGGEII